MAYDWSCISFFDLIGIADAMAFDVLVAASVGGEGELPVGEAIEDGKI